MKGLLYAVLLCTLAVPAGAVPKRAPGLSVESQDELPIPPIPPSSDQLFLAAPVPNSSLTAPTGPARPQGPELSPGFYQPKDYNIGQGYLPGSTVQGEQEHRAKPMPSLRLKVPLQ